MLTAEIQQAYQGRAERISQQPGADVLAKGKTSGSGFQGTPCPLQTSAAQFLANAQLEEEVFGPSTPAVTAGQRSELLQIARALRGHLTATPWGTEEDLATYADLLHILERKVGRLIINGFPTGVKVCHTLLHGGPFPATAESRSTSVGTRAITRFTRPIAYQNFPGAQLPDELKDDNPMGIWRLVNGESVKAGN